MLGEINFTVRSFQVLVVEFFKISRHHEENLWVRLVKHLTPLDLVLYDFLKFLDFLCRLFKLWREILFLFLYIFHLGLHIVLYQALYLLS